MDSLKLENEIDIAWFKQVFGEIFDEELKAMQERMMSKETHIVKHVKEIINDHTGDH